MRGQAESNGLGGAAGGQEAQATCCCVEYEYAEHLYLHGFAPGEWCDEFACICVAGGDFVAQAMATGIGMVDARDGEDGEDGPIILVDPALAHQALGDGVDQSSALGRRRRLSSPSEWSSNSSLCWKICAYHGDRKGRGWVWDDRKLRSGGRQTLKNLGEPGS